jgi:hypothetical protein
MTPACAAHANVSDQQIVEHVTVLIGVDGAVDFDDVAITLQRQRPVAVNQMIAFNALPALRQVDHINLQLAAARTLFHLGKYFDRIVE